MYKAILKAKEDIKYVYIGREAMERNRYAAMAAGPSASIY
jgi:hypothetical protein